MKNKSYYFILISLFIIFLFVPILKAQEVEILYSHSLNGNLLSCPCAVVPIAGLSRRATWIQKDFSRRSLNLELGNFFSSSDSQEKRKAILESFQSLEYTALIPSIQDLSYLHLEDWKNLNLNLVLLSNIKEKGFFKNKDIFLEKKIVSKFRKNFLFISLVSESDFLKLPESIRKNYGLISPKDFFRNIQNKVSFDYIIVILIGELQNFHSEDFSDISHPIFFLAPSSKINPKLGEFPAQLGKVYSTTGNFGNELGILKLNLKTNSIQTKSIQLDVENLKDSPQIKSIAEKYGIKE